MPICAEAREIAEEIWDAIQVDESSDKFKDSLRQRLASQLQRSTTPLVSEAGYYLLHHLFLSGAANAT